jgi:hypothetical protein
MCYLQEFECFCDTCERWKKENPNVAWWIYYVCTCHYKAKVHKCPTCGSFGSPCAPCYNIATMPRRTLIPRGAVIRQADVFAHDFIQKKK